jgi:hypothetical protein
MTSKEDARDLVHCIYCSASTQKAVTDADLKALLAECRRKNGAAGITGILLYRDGSFFQVLEGERESVEALYDKIGLDKRHTKVTKIIFEPIEARDFAEWTMGCPVIRVWEWAKIPGLNDFFSGGSSMMDLGESRANTLARGLQGGEVESEPVIAEI